MTLPDLCAMRWGAAARQPLKTPVRFTSTMSRQSSVVISTSGATLATPELTTEDWRLMGDVNRSEEHTSELQSQANLVCRLLLEKKKKQKPRRESCVMNSDIALILDP